MMRERGWRWTSNQWLSPAVVGLVFLEHLLFGVIQEHLILAAAIAYLTLALGMLAVARYRQRLASIPLASIGVPFAIFLLIGAAGAVPSPDGMASGYWRLLADAPAAVSVDPFSSRLGVVQLAGYGALFIVGVMLAADDTGAKRLSRTIAVAALLFSVWAFVDHLADPRFVFGTERVMADRLGAAFGSANTAATLFGAFTVIAITRLMAGTGRSSDRMAALSAQAAPILLLLFAGTCLLLTASRGGVLATAIGIGVAIAGSLWLKRQRQGSFRMSAKVVIPSVVLVGLILLLVSGEHLLVRSEALDADRAGREQLNSIFWAKALEAPLFGHGVGSFWSVTSTAVTASNAELMFNVRSAHNTYLQWLLQVGFAGGLALLLAFASIMWRLVRGLRHRSRGRTEILAALAVVTVFLVHAFADFSLEVPSIAAFVALILGAGVAVAVPSSERC